MSEQEQSSQLSALFDGELPPQQAQMVIRRALKDPALRSSWDRYALIGACLRGEPLGASLSVADRVQASLAAEPESNILALPARAGSSRGAGSARYALFGRGALGGAIAAGVALVSILLVRSIAPAGEEAGAMLAADAAPRADLVAQSSQAGGAEFIAAISGGPAESAPGSYTTPGINAPAQRRMTEASLGYYLTAHSEEAASALRFISYDLAQGSVELTDEDISALR